MAESMRERIELAMRRNLSLADSFDFPTIDGFSEAIDDILSELEKPTYGMLEAAIVAHKECLDAQELGTSPMLRALAAAIRTAREGK